MKLGVFFIGNPQSGGLYQYSLAILDSLKNRSDKVVIFNLSGASFPYEKYKDCFKVSNSLRLMSLLKQFSANIRPKPRPDKGTQATGNVEETGVNKKSHTMKGLAKLLNWMEIFLLRLLVKLNWTNLLIITAPSELSFKLGTPYIMPVHDLQHRLNPQFPEVSADDICEEREYLYSNAIPKAEAILVDSEIGKEDVLKFYQADSGNVKVLPFTPPNYLRADYAEGEFYEIRRKYHLPQRFLFYPANFWQHKNHKLIVQALNNIKTNHGLKIPAVFVGSKQLPYNEFDKVWKLANTYELEGQLQYLGYVPDGDMGCLYKLAEALVMPTFFGPTNIPYLEAFAMGCPVVGSDIRGVREQIGDAGLLVDPNSPEALAAAILRIWNEAGLRETLIARGHDKTKLWGFERFSGILNKLVDEIGERLAAGN